MLYSKEEIKAMNDEETVEALNGMWSNFSVTDAYEPGSVVKPIVMAAALEKGAIQESDTFVCDGSQTFGDTLIKCAVWPDAHGTETLGEVIANSCNDAMMQIGAKLGSRQFVKAQSLFNFGTRTGIDLPNEGAGIIHTRRFHGRDRTCMFCLRTGIYLYHDPGDQCHVFRYQWRLLLSAASCDEDLRQQRKYGENDYSGTLLKQTISSQYLR